VSIEHHPAILGSTRQRWPDEAACQASAAALARRPSLRDAVVELRGPLGAGKTTFARHLLRALGVEGRIKSPTYAVMEPYTAPAGFDVAHFDFYRFDDAREWEDAGFRDVFGRRGLKLIEWPERARAVLPTPDLALSIEPIDETRRDVRFDAYSEIGVGLLR
jgi:tRNA threonylcarbamoyladenosine biosynthesis protein TsaE